MNNGFQNMGLPSMEMANFGMGGMSMGAPAPVAAPVVSAPPASFGMTMAPTGSGIRGPGGAIAMPPTGAGAAGGQQQGFFGRMGGMEGFASLAQGLASLGQIYGAFQGVKLAKEQLGLQREAYQTNLANQRQSYNTALEDRINTRHVMEGRGAGETEAYLAKNRL